MKEQMKSVPSGHVSVVLAGIHKEQVKCALRCTLILLIHLVLLYRFWREEKVETWWLQGPFNAADFIFKLHIFQGNHPPLLSHRWVHCHSTSKYCHERKEKRKVITCVSPDGSKSPRESPGSLHCRLMGLGSSSLWHNLSITAVYTFYISIIWIKQRLVPYLTVTSSNIVTRTHVEHFLDVEFVIDPITEDVLILPNKSDVGVCQIHPWFLQDRGQRQAWGPPLRTAGTLMRRWKWLISTLHDTTA